MRAGWSGGMFRAWKLCQSSSTSGPSATRNPRLVNTSTASRSTIVSGWSDPIARRAAGQASCRGRRPRAGRPRPRRSRVSRRCRRARPAAPPAARWRPVRRACDRRASSEPSDFWIALNGDLPPHDLDLRRLELVERRSAVGTAPGHDRARASSERASPRGPSGAESTGRRRADRRRRRSVARRVRDPPATPDGSVSRPSSTVPQHRPPWASATPRATNSPILLPAPSPGRLGVKSASTSSSRQLGDRSRRAHCERPPSQRRRRPRSHPRCPTTRATPEREQRSS